MATKFKRTIMLTVFAIISTIALFKAGIFRTTRYLYQTIPKPISSLTGCHQHGANLFCLTPDGDEVEVLLPGNAPGSKSGHSDSGSEPQSGIATSMLVLSTASKLARGGRISRPRLRTSAPGIQRPVARDISVHHLCHQRDRCFWANFPFIISAATVQYHSRPA
ncbi:unnamed protein product [Parascedosporium putredinis]|uniref:Uncharacterized protein n=1 Tax=Parascedosporium putredinis TaxID=1442378 RepID=A0A9P1H062_9PEZI|nr:unnamed protein product [Parascedosporium putredinis]CAI7993584.1 unnamed protein product [Parascedosporium putredinis]